MHLMLSQSPHFFFHSFFFILFQGSDFHHSVFELTYLFFCLIYSAIDSFYCIFSFGYYIAYLCLFEYLLDLCTPFFSQDLGLSLLSLLWIFSGQLPISALLSCSSGVLFYPFIWNIFLCCFILSNLLRLQSHRLQDHGSSCFLCLSPSRHGFFFVFGGRRSFLRRFHFFLVNGCSAVSCDFDVSMRAGELRSFYSTILSGQASQQMFSEPAALCQGLCQSWGTTTELQIELRGQSKASKWQRDRKTLGGQKCHSKNKARWVIEMWWGGGGGGGAERGSRRLWRRRWWHSGWDVNGQHDIHGWFPA